MGYRVTQATHKEQHMKTTLKDVSAGQTGLSDIKLLDWEQRGRGHLPEFDRTQSLE